MVRPPVHVINPLCGELEVLDLYYKRWLKGHEKTALTPVFSDIVSSRGEDFSLSLGFAKLEEVWRVNRPGGSLHRGPDHQEFIIGISSRHGIIPLETRGSSLLTEVPFKEAGYLLAHGQLSNDCLSSLHHIVELRVVYHQDIPTTTLPPHLPLLHTLRVFEAEDVHPSFLAGHTFHKLERCKMSLYGGDSNLTWARSHTCQFAQDWM